MSCEWSGRTKTGRRGLGLLGSGVPDRPMRSLRRGVSRQLCRMSRSSATPMRRWDMERRLTALLHLLIAPRLKLKERGDGRCEVRTDGSSCGCDSARGKPNANGSHGNKLSESRSREAAIQAPGNVVQSAQFLSHHALQCRQPCSWPTCGSVSRLRRERPAQSGARLIGSTEGARQSARWGSITLRGETARPRLAQEQTGG